MDSRSFAVFVALAASIAFAAPTAAAAPYIVTVASGVSPSAKAKKLGVTTKHVYGSSLNGYAADLSPSQVSTVAADSQVIGLAPDTTLSLAKKSGPPSNAGRPQRIPNGVRYIGGLASQTAAIDGVDTRVDVDIAIIDTGIQSQHEDLNVAGGINCGNGSDPAKWEDGIGHGTQVAGITAALDNAIGVVGVAPGARVWAVRVGNGSSIPSSDILCGVDWVSAHSDVIEVANMSLGGKGTNTPNCGTTTSKQGVRVRDPLHLAICGSVAAGVTYVASAGNEADDTANYVPAAYDEVIAVSALADFDGRTGGLATTPCPAGTEQADDTFATFSNFGAPVDFAAPGVCIDSTYLGSQYFYGTGTSFSSPHVAGAAALVRATTPSATPAQVATRLRSIATPGPVSGDPDSFPEPILNVAGL